MSMCAVMVGLFAYTLLFLGIYISLEDEREQVQAILRTIINKIIKGNFSLAIEAVRTCIGRLLRMAAYPVKTIWIALYQTLRARLGTRPRYIGFSACLGVITRPLFSKLKLVTFCLFSFCLGVVVTMAYYHSQSLSTYAHFASSELSLAASDLTHRAEALFATITVANLNSVLTVVLFYLGLQFSVRSLLSSIASISYHNKKARSLWPKASLLINKDDKQDSPILEDKSLPESDKDILCNDMTIILKVDDDADEDEHKRDVSSQEAVANGDKEDSLKQLCEAIISNLSSATEVPKHASGSAHSLSLCASPVCPTSLQQQQVEKAVSQPTCTSSLSASSPEFVPRSRNTAVCASTQEYCPPHWALASPVSVRITAPVKRARIRRGARLQNAEMVVANGLGSSSRNSRISCV